MILKSHKDLGVHSNIDSSKIYGVSRMITRLMSMPVQPNKAIVGRNAFAHSSGIHQDGVIKHRENYEIIDPKEVGVPESSIVLTARSGRAALKHNLEKLGIELTKEELDTAYQNFLDLADSKKDFTTDDLLSLVGKTSEEGLLSIDSLKVTCGTDELRTAEIVINKNGELIKANATGNGPVDATLKAINSIMGKEVTVEEYLVQLITGGSDDVGQVHYQISKNGVFYYGYGKDTDIVYASAKAYLEAINKVI